MKIKPNLPPTNGGPVSNNEDSVKRRMDEDLRKKVAELAKEAPKPLTPSQIKQAERTQGDFPG